MRTIVIQEFITLDGVMQAPGAPDEDTTGGFKFGGWTAPYFTGAAAEAGQLMGKWMQPTDLLLGRKTFDIFEQYWPKHADQWEGIMDVAKYCVSTTKSESDWTNSKFIKDVEAIKELKASGGDPINVIGSGKLVQSLLKHDLVDEMRLMMFPITLGTGKRLFEEGTIPAAFTLEEKLISTNGVFFASYRRAGDVKTGTVG